MSLDAGSLNALPLEAMPLESAQSDTDRTAMDETEAADGPHEVVFRLPVGDWPQAVYRGSYRYDRGALWVDGTRVIDVCGREAVRAGVAGSLADGTRLSLRMLGDEGEARLLLEVDGQPAPLESELRAPTSRSAWIHGWIGLAASAAGFAAGYLYLQKAQLSESAWALKMGYHTAGWHALLTITLLPASVWGQRLGIRSVQVVSAVFFCIHVGIAIANGVWPDAGSNHDGWIAVLNALSGVFFLGSVVYGQRAHRDMNPLGPLNR